MKPTQEQVIAWAEEAGVHEGGKDNWVAGNRWETALTLAYEAGRADENEACAKIVDMQWQGHYREVAAQIRERGRTMMYRCSKCHRLYKRDSTKAWIKSYCEKTGQHARLIRREQ